MIRWCGGVEAESKVNTLLYVSINLLLGNPVPPQAVADKRSENGAETVADSTRGFLRLADDAWWSAIRTGKSLAPYRDCLGREIGR